jgi:hypothetical protein
MADHPKMQPKVIVVATNRFIVFSLLSEHPPLSVGREWFLLICA